MRPRNTLFPLLLLLLRSVGLQAQSESTSVFNFLSLPTSAHSMGLGGVQVALPDDDASLMFLNPALMADVSDKSINFSFFTYMKGSKAANIAWTMASGERGTWGVGAQFVGYGSMKETNVEGVQMGNFSALDMALEGGYTYTLTDRLSGGALGKFIYSKYGSYSSVALAVDLGLNYFIEESDFSLSLVAANVGWQVKTFGDTRERIPFDLRLGFTKRLANAPIRLSLTMTDLTRWRASDYYSADGKVKGGKIFMNHFVLGADVLLSSQFYVSVGYNFRRASELKAAGSSHAAGLCFGAGMEIKRFKLGLAYAKYHVSVPSFMLTAQYSL